MKTAQGRLSSKSETAGAIRYALARWRALTRYSDEGLLELDNSVARLALRAVALATIADHPMSRVEELLPWNLAASLPATSSQTA